MDLHKIIYKHLRKYLRYSHLVLKIAIIWSLVAVVLIAIGVLAYGYYVYRYQTPAPEELIKREISETSVIYDRTGEHVLYQLYGEENRKILAHAEIPDVVRAATIVAEDRSFYSHWGIDPIASLRALKVNLTNQEMLQGGSTITQQLVRNWFLSRQKTYARKFMEAILAIKLERNLSKDEILDAYLNQVPYGSNAYGIQSASEVFFGKDAKDLSLDEAAILAALPKATTYYSPYGKNRKDLAARARQIIKDMAQEDYISNSQAVTFIKEDALAKVKNLRQTIIAPHFVFYVIDELNKKYGQEFLKTGGLRIYTTLDYDMQQKAEEAVAQNVQLIAGRGASNAGLVAVDPKNGDILAMAGSLDYFSESAEGEVNVTTSLRQPGSSFKPIVYAAAFEAGFQPETLIDDKETNFGKDGTGKDYIPHNYDYQYHGILPMRSALAMSLNIPAVKTLSLVGADAGKEMAQRLGITSYNDPKTYGLSLAIGGYEVKLLDLTGAFSVFANDGKKNTPQGISVIKKGNEDIFVKNSGETQVLDPEVARKIDSILSDNNARAPVFGSRNPLYIPGRTVAAKTGTSQDFRDAWTVGFTPWIAAGVWVGNNDGRLMKSGSDGIYTAAPVWRSFMDKIISAFPEEKFIAYKMVPKDKMMALDEEDKKAFEKCNKKSEKKRAQCLAELAGSNNQDKKN